MLRSFTHRGSLACMHRYSSSIASPSSLVKQLALIVRYRHSHTDSRYNSSNGGVTGQSNSHFRSSTPQHFRNNKVSPRDTIKSFFTKTHVKTKELNTYLDANFPTMQVPDVSQLLYSAALSNHVLSGSQLDQVIVILESYIQQYQPKLFHKYFYNPVHFSRLMYGLKVLQPQNHDVRGQLSHLLTTLNTMLQLKNTNTFHNAGDNVKKNDSGNLVSSNSGLFNARSFSMCIFGIQNIRIEHATNGPVLLELIRKFREIAQHLHDVDPYTLSYMIHGVKSLSTSNVDVQDLFAVIINKAVHLPGGVFTYQLVCNNIGALVQHKDPSSREVLSLLHILTERLRDCDHVLDANLMGVFFFHIRQLVPHSNAPLSEEAISFISILTDKVDTSPHIPSPIQIANMLDATKYMFNDHPAVRTMQKVVIDKAQRVQGKFSPRDLSKCMSSLKHMHLFESERVVTLLTQWLENGLLNKKKLNSKDIESCLYGLRFVKCTSIKVRRLIRIFAMKMGESTHPVGATSVAHAFYFLRSADCTHSEVLLFLNELHDKIQTSAIQLDERQAAMLYGLKCIRNPYPAIRPIIAMLCDTWTPLHRLNHRIGFGFLEGLSCLNSDYPETRELLSRVLNDLQRNTFELHHAKNIGYSLRAAFSVLTNMTAEHVEVRDYLVYLTNEIETMLQVRSATCANTAHTAGSRSGPLCSQSSSLSTAVISDCFFYCKNLNSDFQEVQMLIRVLLRSCQEPVLRNQDVARALHGMQNMTLISITDGPDNSMRELLRFLSRNLTHETALMSVSEICMALYGMKGMPAEDEDVREVLGKLLQQAEERTVRVYSTPSESQSLHSSSARQQTIILSVEEAAHVLCMVQELLPPVVINNQSDSGTESDDRSRVQSDALLLAGLVKVLAVVHQE